MPLEFGGCGADQTWMPAVVGHLGDAVVGEGAQSPAGPRADAFEPTRRQRHPWTTEQSTPRGRETTHDPPSSPHRRELRPRMVTKSGQYGGPPCFVIALVVFVIMESIAGPLMWPFSHGSHPPLNRPNFIRKWRADWSQGSPLPSWFLSRLEHMVGRRTPVCAKTHRPRATDPCRRRRLPRRAVGKRMGNVSQRLRWGSG